MVRLLFDHQTFSIQKYGGISRYFANIINEMSEYQEFKPVVGVLNSQNHYLKNKPFLFNNALANKIIVSKYGNRTYRLNSAYCNYLIDKSAYDIFHPTYYDSYFIGKVKKPVVLTVHDMTHERLPEYFWAMNPLTSQKRQTIDRADKIIAISNATKNDILRYSDADPRKIEVIYHGIDIQTPLTTEPVHGLPEEYILFVGDRSGYKNFYVFIDAFREVSQKHPSLEVVLTGGGPMGIADKELLRRLKLTEKVKHYQVNDNQLNYIYRNALLFVYPSLNEGFGLPILEAYKSECPTILSDIECFREIAQDAALFFSPHDPGHLAEIIDRSLGDSALRERLVNDGTRRLRDFPIEKSLHQTLDLYRSLT